MSDSTIRNELRTVSLLYKKTNIVIIPDVEDIGNGLSVVTLWSYSNAKPLKIQRALRNAELDS